MMDVTKPSLLTALLTCTIVCACTGGYSTTTPAAPSQASAVSVAIGGTASLTAVAQTSQLTATATLSDGTTQNVTTSATWQSSSSTVATVSAAGLVTAVAAGTTTITATYQGRAGTFTVTVAIAAPPSFAFLAGNWVGTWTDTRYNVSGTLNATFTVNGSTVTATGVIGLASLGLGNETGSGTGTVSGQTLTFTFSSATVGAGSGTLGTGGAGSGAGSVTGTLNFGAFTYTGNVTPSVINGTFAFTSPTGGNGVASLTKQ